MMNRFKLGKLVANSFLVLLLWVLSADAVTYAQMVGHSSLIYANNTFVFSPRALQWQAINQNGQVVRTGAASGGRSYCPDIRRSCRTPLGVYRIISKGGAECRSSRYPINKGGARMPYCMFFSKYYAIHGSYEVPHYNASHGCIRVHPYDAQWLSGNFIKIGTKIVVKPY